MHSPWTWVPTLYFVEGLPYFIVNTIALAVFKDLGMDNGTLGLVTTVISLPWLIKPLWSPFVDILRSKRWWILSMQVIMAAAVLLLGVLLPFSPFVLSLLLFVVVAFASATHDIAADGFYMLALDEKRQSAFVGIRSTFYRIASVFGQGVLVMLSGVLQRRGTDAAASWAIVLAVASAILALVALYHFFAVPKPASDRNADGKTSGQILREFGESFSSFFRKKGVWLAVAFMLLYRLPEALSVNMLYPFFKDPVELGGLGLGTDVYGLVYGTFGVVALLLGGILGGLCASRYGLSKSMFPMALSLALPCAVYLFMAIAQPSEIWVVGSCIVFDQFGYGFGFTAYMLLMMHFVDGPLKTSHYAICTAFMWLSMKIPGLVSGYLQQALGYTGFFVLVMVCCLATLLAAWIGVRPTLVRR